MAIFKRGKFYWYEFTHNGHRVRNSTKQGDKETAKKLMAAERSRLARVDAGLEPAEPEVQQRSLSISDLLDGLESDYRIRGKLRAGNRSTIAKARQEFGSVPTKALTGSRVDVYIERELADGYAPATINRVTEIVGRAYRLAKQPVPDIRHLSEKENVRRGFFTVQEFEAIANNLPEDLRDFCRFGFITGWRKNEISSLRWCDVEDGLIRLRAEHSKNRQARQIPIEGEVVELINRRQAARSFESPSGTTLSDYVFHREGQRISEFRKSWASACVAVGLGKMLCPKCGQQSAERRCKPCKAATRYSGRIFHDLRRSAVRNMVRGGVPQSIAMRVSGHKTAAMFRRYDITDERDLREAMLTVQQYHKEQSRKTS